MSVILLKYYSDTKRLFLLKIIENQFLLKTEKLTLLINIRVNFLFVFLKFVLYTEI